MNYSMIICYVVCWKQSILRSVDGVSLFIVMIEERIFRGDEGDALVTEVLRTMIVSESSISGADRLNDQMTWRNILSKRIVTLRRGTYKYWHGIKLLK